MDDFGLIEKIVSKDRLSSYLSLSNGDKKKAIDLYIENIRVSEELYGLISEFEVVFRNSLNKQLSSQYGEEWYDSPKLKFLDIHLTAIKRVKEDLEKDRKPKTNPNIISNLNLGYWVYLFNPFYDTTLWRGCLFKVFANKKSLNRSRVRLELDKIKKLRNRVAHCECILKYPYKQLSRDIIELLNWINADYAKWVVHVCNVGYLKS